MPFFNFLSKALVCTVKISCLTGLWSHAFKQSTKTIQGSINETGRKQAQISSTGKVKDRRETNTKIN